VTDLRHALADLLWDAADHRRVAAARRVTEDGADLAGGGHASEEALHVDQQSAGALTGRRQGGGQASRPSANHTDVDIGDHCNLLLGLYHRLDHGWPPGSGMSVLGDQLVARRRGTFPP